MGGSTWYMIAAYVCLFGAIGGYHLWMGRRLKALETERRELEARLGPSRAQAPEA